MTPPESTSLTNDPIAFCPPLAKAFGVCQALLLQQIHYWCCKKKNSAAGHYWVYNTSQQWADQLWAFDERTIRNALTALRASGLVITGLYNKRKSDKTLWYRLDYKQLVLQLAAKLPDWKILPHPSGKFFHIHVEKTPVALPETIPETIEEINLAKASPSQPAAPLLKKVAGKKIVITKGPSSAKQILHNLQVQQGKVPAVKPNSSASLHAIWRTVPKFNEGIDFMAELTLRQRGGLSYMAKSWGPTADSNLKYLIQHWVAFTKFVAGQKGIKKTPNVPSIEFLQKYVGEAASFVLQQSVQSIALPVTATPVSGKLLGTPVKNKAASAPVSKALVPSSKVDSTDEVASLDDVLKWKPKSKD